MKKIKDLYALLNEEKDFEKRYPQFNPDDGKIHMLYLSACLNGTGYFPNLPKSNRSSF